MMKVRGFRTILIQAVIAIIYVLLMGSIIYAADARYPAGWQIQYTTQNLCYVGTDEVVTVPTSITELDMFAFYGNRYIKELIIPATVKRIQNYSIYNVPNLRSIIIYGNPVITEHSVHSCPQLRSMSVSNNSTYAYSFAERMSIPVKVGFETGFPKSEIYLLEGDKCKQSICNSKSDPTIWKSSKKSVASVDSQGRVTARKAGRARITAVTKAGEYSYMVQVYKKSVSNRVKQIRNEETLKSKSNYEKIKAVHNWMIRNIRYDYKNYLRKKIPRSAGTVEGALLKKLCVCEGYALAFRKLMSSYHIPCKLVYGRANGERHAWNMVKLNGNWYHVDVTWDDPIVNGNNGNTNIHYEYFLKSTDYMRAHMHSFRTSSYPRCTSRKYDSSIN